MGEFSDEHPETTSFNSFATYWFKTLLAVFLRSVRSPALAYDSRRRTGSGKSNLKAMMRPRGSSESVRGFLRPP